MYSCGPLHKDEQRQDVLLEPTYSSSVPIWEVDLRICRKQWTIGVCGERGSGLSVLIVWHDDDNTYTLNYKLWNLIPPPHTHIHTNKQKIFFLRSVLYLRPGVVKDTVIQIRPYLKWKYWYALLKWPCNNPKISTLLLYIYTILIWFIKFGNK